MSNSDFQTRRRQRRHLDRLDDARGPDVRPARFDEIPALVGMASAQIPDLAAFEDIVVRVHEIDPTSVLAIDRSTTLLGGIALLFLNEAGLRALLIGGFNFQDPELSHLARRGEIPAGIYVWAFCARGAAVGGIGRIMAWMKRDGRRDVHFYARPSTEEGRRLMSNRGFAPFPCRQPGLWRYVREPDKQATDFVSDARFPR